MDMGKYLFGVAGFAAIATFWEQIKQFFVRFKSIFIVTAKIEYRLNQALANYLWSNFKYGALGVKLYKGHNVYVRPNKMYELVAFEDMGKSITFFKGLKPIFISKTQDNTNGPKTVTEDFTIQFIRGTFNLNKLITEAVANFNKIEKEENQDRYYVRYFYGRYSQSSDIMEKAGSGLLSEAASCGLKPVGINWSDIGPPKAKSPFSHLFYPDNILDLIDYIQKWKNSESWYKDRGLPWKLGALLKGLPGTGKSSFVRAIAQKFDFPIDVYDLVSMSNEELTQFWRDSLNRSPCIVLIEDIDRIFDKGELIQQSEFAQKGKLTMNGLLNTISGIDSSDGIITFITANDTTKIDKSLGISDEKGKSTRPGRIDKIITFDLMPEHCRRAMAELILSDCKELINNTIEAGNGETGAQFSKRCSDIALKEYWK